RGHAPASAAAVTAEPAARGRAAPIKKKARTVGSLLPDLIASPLAANVVMGLVAGLQHVPLTSAIAAITAAVAAALAASDELGTRLSAVEGVAKPSGLKRLPLNIKTSMDPRLQLALANSRSGKKSVALTSTQGNEVAVIARVKDVDTWASLPDVEPTSTL